MKLSISNIAWSKEYDEEIYKFLQNNKFDGIEIAPTRIFESNPYENLKEAKNFQQYLKDKYSLEISSMQSIWFGKTENIFNSDEERIELINYTKKAIEFANVIKCKNLVFGCPKNRNISNENLENKYVAIDFFRTLGNYAMQNNTIVAIEPNPNIYGTNFINYTKEAFDFVREVNNPGIKVNIDLGTIINNNEDISIIENNIDLINHIHISEPYLEKIQERNIHKELCELLNKSEYNKYVSIEMKNLNDLEGIKATMLYVNEIFRE